MTFTGQWNLFKPSASFEKTTERSLLSNPMKANVAELVAHNEAIEMKLLLDIQHTLDILQGHQMSESVTARSQRNVRVSSFENSAG